MSCGKARLNVPRQIRSVTRSRNPTTMLSYNASRYGTQVVERLGCEALNLPGTDVSTWLDGLKPPAARMRGSNPSVFRRREKRVGQGVPIASLGQPLRARVLTICRVHIESATCGRMALHGIIALD